MKSLIYNHIYIYILTTGITWVTPSPLSITVPVKVLLLSCLSFAVQLAAKANTACTAIYKPLAPNDSKKISAVYSLFSGGFKGGSVFFQRLLINYYTCKVNTY